MIEQRSAEDGAEMAVLGGMLLSKAAIGEVTELVAGRDFYQPKHEQIFAAITAVHGRGEPADAVTVANELTKRGELSKVGGPAYLHTLMESVPTAANAGYYAEIVQDKANRRRLDDCARRVHQAVDSNTTTPEDLAEVVANLRAQLDSVTESAVRAKGLPAPTIKEFLDTEDEPYDWLVPGLLERGDRVILTGEEGMGKSTLLRSMAVQLAAGIHPFGGPELSPLRVLLLDIENSKRQVRRKIRPLVDLTKGGDLALFPVIHPAGLDLLDPEDSAKLTATIADVRPDVVIGGPIYKLAGGDPSDEEPARVVSKLFDRLRTEYGFALILEAHSPHASGGGKRPIRPFGPSLWLRWPEFGIHLSPEGELRHWRGQRDEREWPVVLQRGGEWPWTAVTRPLDVYWARIKDVCRDWDSRPSQRDLAEVLKTSQATVSRAIAEHKVEWDRLSFEANP